MSNNYEEGVELLKEDNLELAKEKFIKSYEEGNKRALYYLRKIKNMQAIPKHNLDKLQYTTEKSKLGYEVEIPTKWLKAKSIDDRCFDTITFEKYDDHIINIKTQGFLIEIPDGCIDLISIDGVISHIGNIDRVEEYKNEYCEGKIVKSEEIDGTISYTLMTIGKKGIYEFKISIDQFLDESYREVKDYIFNSFKIIE